jgi:hypothetical protein
MQQISTDRLLGRDTAGMGNVEEISVGGGLEFSGSAGIQRSALTGDVTAPAGSNITTIANDAVTFAKMQNIATQTLIGRGTAGTGDPESITLASSLSIAGGALGVVADTTRQLTKVKRDTADIGTQSTMHYVRSDAVGISWSITDDVGNNEIDISFEMGSWSTVGNVTADNILAASTGYWGIYGGQVTDNATETNRIVYWPYDATWKNLYVRTFGAQPGTGALTLTLRVGLADTTITVTVAAGGAAGSYSDTSNTASSTQGDAISIKGVNAAATNSATCAWSIANRAKA